MTGDFTRDSFDPEKGYTRVLIQQGRPQLDADLNEQVSILWRYWRTLTTDLIGPFAGPNDNCGFGVVTPGVINELPANERDYLRKMLKASSDFLLSPGRYYVNGILCENSRHITYSSQTDLLEKPFAPQRSTQYLIYLDVWERPVSGLEDNAICEPALNGIDTSLRTKVTCRVRAAELPANTAYSDGDSGKIKEHWATIMREWQAERRGSLKATVEVEGSGFDDHGHLPQRKYQGPQNQLYRVEVHQGGTVGGGQAPTFKVSRENGSVMFRASINGEIATLESTGRDSRFGLKPRDWVEVCDAGGATLVQDRMAPPLLQVRQADASRSQVILSDTPAVHDYDGQLILRRWDHREGDLRRGGLELRDGAAVIKEGDGKSGWLSLENGLRIQFQKSTPANAYRTGDYWLIPARVAGDGVLWPNDHDGKPKAVAPHGVNHCYAPLAVVALDKNGVLETQGDCRPKFKMPVAFGF